MKELLLSEILNPEIETIKAVALIEEHIFGHQVDLSDLEIIAEHCQQEIDDIDDELTRAEHLINELYVHQLFIDNKRLQWSVASHQINNSLAFRVISPILKAVMLQHMIELCGFEVDIVFIPEKVMLRIVCNEDFAIIFEPVTGESLTWYDLEQRLAEFANDDIDPNLQSIDHHDLLLKYVSSLKTALILEQHFGDALKCVDILLAMRPDDPFERRDRGFLLHQLDCFKVACDDYRYFVEQCPQDPAAQLLKIQLDNINTNNTVLH